MDAMGRFTPILPTSFPRARRKEEKSGHGKIGESG